MSEITKEQAIEALDRIEPVLCRFGGGDLVRALNRAIEFIEQQPVEREAWAWEERDSLDGIWREKIRSYRPAGVNDVRNVRRVFVREAL